MRIVSDGCGCFPTGRHYPGIAHLLRTVIRGVADEFAQDRPWRELDIAMIDLECTGTDASIDRVVEIGIAIGRGGEIVERHQWLVNPAIPIPDAAREVHGIGDADVKDQPLFGVVAPDILRILQGRIPAAYNAGFDKTFLGNEVARAQLLQSSGKLPPALRREVMWLDPLVWAREIQQDERSRALSEVTARLGIKQERAHRASEDAEAALKVLYALSVDNRVPKTYGGLIQEQRRLEHMQADERRMWRN